MIFTLSSSKTFMQNFKKVFEKEKNSKNTWSLTCWFNGNMVSLDYLIEHMYSTETKWNLIA